MHSQADSSRDRTAHPIQGNAPARGPANRSTLLVFALLAPIVALMACGGGTTTTPSNPTPSISSLSPNSVNAGGAAFTLTVNGSGFITTSVVRWNGTDRTTTFVNGTQLTAAITAGDIAAAGTANVTVFTPSPGGGQSGMPFTVANPIPAISGISPTNSIFGGAAFTLTVNGSGFVSASVVRWNGADRTTTFVNGTQLTAAISASDVASAGTANVAVFTPAPGGGASNAVPFTISNPVPAISGISPDNSPSGASALTLTVNGTNFVSASVVRWNGADRTTTFVNGTQLTAAITAGDIAAAGMASVTVFTPSPGGGASNTVSFAVTNPLPVVNSLSSVKAPAGWPGAAIRINGSGFVAASEAQWNGQPRVTEVLSESSLLAVITADDMSAQGVGQVTVFNAAPGGGTSSSVDFIVYPVAPDAAGVVDRASVSPELRSGNDSSFSPSLSADGRYVAFVSRANNLAPDDTNNMTDIFLRDTCQGAPAGCTPNVTRISVDVQGDDANGNSFEPWVSADARFVAFSSSATNLVANTNGSGSKVYIRDTCLGAPVGCTATTILVTPNADEQSFSPSLSSDGRYIGYLVLVPGPDITVAKVADTCLGGPVGCTPGIVGSDNSNASAARLSGNGRYLAFETAASLVAEDTNTFSDIYLHDTCVGGPIGCTPSTLQVSVADDGSQGNDFSFFPVVSADGRYVAFSSWASNFVAGDTNSHHDVFLRDTCVGAVGCTPSTIRVSVTNAGTETDVGSGGPATEGPSISADGRFIAFGTRATNVVNGDNNNTFDVFVRDTCQGGPVGCVPTTILVSQALDGTIANNRSDGPRISGDGRCVAFQSSATNLAPHDGTTGLHVFLACTGLP
jgi:trimeric autotransporter adhesin